MFDFNRSGRSLVAGRTGRPGAGGPIPDGYKWMALFISTLGMLMATIDGSITLISLPNIFRGIDINPLEPGNSFFLLWMILGFLVVTSVLVVTLGRLGDIYGRVRTYNFGFAVFTFFSLVLSVTWMTGHAAGFFLIVMRIFQAVGAAMLMANSAAILTDAFPPEERGMAMGINQAAAFSGAFVGLVLGGVLAPINWRLIFLVSVPVGLDVYKRQVPHGGTVAITCSEGPVAPPTVLQGMEITSLALASEAGCTDSQTELRAV